MATKNVSRAKKNLENREKLLQIKKEREDITNLYLKYSENIPKPKLILPSKIRPVRSNTKCTKIETLKSDYSRETLFSRDFTFFEPTCGGEILWIACEESIEIISNDGRVLKVFAFPRVTTMAQTKGCIWTGFHDGFIRVFDKYSFSCVHAKEAHTKGITCLTKGIGDTFYSASIDGTVVEWCEDENTVRQTMVLQLSSQSISHMVCYGFRLFAILSEHMLEEYDAENGSHVRSFPANGSKITHVNCNNGFLFTLQEGKLVVWDITHGTCIREIQSGNKTKFVSAFDDSTSENIVMVDESGEISVYECNPGSNFGLVTRTDILGPHGVSSLKGLPFLQKSSVLISYRDGRNHIFTQTKDLLAREISHSCDKFRETHAIVCQKSEEAEKASSAAHFRKVNLMLNLSKMCNKHIYIEQRRKIYMELMQLSQLRKRKYIMMRSAHAIQITVQRITMSRCFLSLKKRLFVLKKIFIFRQNTLQLSHRISLSMVNAYWGKLVDGASEKAVRGNLG